MSLLELTPSSRATRSGPSPGRTGPLSVVVACPDARPPAYQAVAGLARAGCLDRFVTGFYHGGDGPVLRTAQRFVPRRAERLASRLRRRHLDGIPPRQVDSFGVYDAALALENRLGGSARRAVARWRTETFDRALRERLRRNRPDAALIFSDVGSELAGPACRELGIRSVLSVVHGDIHEENELLRDEAERSPEFFPLYLGDAPIDRLALDWLHQRRRRDSEWADHILVPSDHLRDRLIRQGTLAGRISVIPYAADTERFAPNPRKIHERSHCTFLFAGGISQRKGIGYLLQAWRKVRRPGWTLQLLGSMPHNLEPLQPYLEGVELLGRVGHAEMPARLASADVFVFPSLFEGSAVVTYEALACGLPSIVTPNAGSVVRDGHDGFLVPPQDVATLAWRMEQLADDPALRAWMSAQARARAEAYDWRRYQTAVRSALAGESAEFPTGD